MNQKELLKDAFYEYSSLIHFLRDYVFPFRRDFEIKNGNKNYSVELGLKSFDLLLQYSMIELAVADNKFDDLEATYISKLCDYLSFPNFLNSIGFKDITWDLLLKSGSEIVTKVLNATKEDVVKITQDFVNSFALFDVATKNADYCLALRGSIVKICGACIGIDDDFSQEEKNKPLLIYEAIHAIELIKNDNEANNRSREQAPNLREKPQTEQPKEPHIRRLCDFYKQSSHIVNFVDSNITYDKKEEGLIYIESEKGSGSGFIINSSGLALTCNHVVEGANEIFVRIDDGNGLREVKRASVLYKDVDDDFAVIQIQDVNNTAYFELEENYANVKTGDDIAIFGFPYGTQLNDNPMELEPTLNKGYVASKNKILDKKVFYLDARSAPGNSGGPVFSLISKKVIGYLCGSYGSDRANLVFCRSLSEFYKSELAKYKGGKR